MEVQLKKKSIRKDCGNKPFRMLFVIFLHAFSLRMGDHLRCHLLLELLAEQEGMELLHPEQELELPEELHLLEGMEIRLAACHPA